MKNVITWIETPVADFTSAKKFYETVLKVKIELVQTPGGK